MKNNAVQNENGISGVYCSSRCLEHIFPPLQYWEKSSSKKWLTASINHNEAMHSLKLFSTLSLIQSNVLPKKVHSKNFAGYNTVHLIYQFVTFDSWKVS